MIRIDIISNFPITLLMFLFYMQYETLNKDKIELDTDDIEYSYLIKQSIDPPDINSEWDKKIWNETRSLGLSNFMGDKPTHFPETKVKLRYDKVNIYVIFSVRDRYIKAVAKETNGKVWEDSCVEFFFSPGPDVERGYFNFEANCKGVFLFQYHLNNDGTKGLVSADDYEKVKISHSLIKDVEQESTEPEVWTLEYNIPISILSKYMEVDVPKPGVNWRGNFYKCADKTSHPHWLTWAPVDHPVPKFHLPEFFGHLKFE